MVCLPLSAADPGLTDLPDQPSWSDSTGRAVSLSDFRGQAVVLTMAYTTCKTRCPMAMRKLEALETAFAARQREVAFVVVTLDPARDTPDVLARWKARRGLSRRWHLLVGTPAETAALASQLDVHVKDDAPHLMHDTRIVVFDEAGHRARAYQGWGFDADEAARPDAR